MPALLLILAGFFALMGVASLSGVPAQPPARDALAPPLGPIHDLTEQRSKNSCTLRFQAAQHPRELSYACTKPRYDEATQALLQPGATVTVNEFAEPSLESEVWGVQLNGREVVSYDELATDWRRKIRDQYLFAWAGAALAAACLVAAAVLWFRQRSRA